MDDLERARARIDAIDAQMIELFRQRMDCVVSIAAYKREHSLPVLDSSRELQRIEAAESLVSPDLRPYVARLMEAIMGLSRDRQDELLRQGQKEA